MKKIAVVWEKTISILGRWNVSAILTSAVLLMCFIVITVFMEAQKVSLEEQLQAKRWSEDEKYAQISLFLSEKEAVTAAWVNDLRYRIGNSLKSQSIEPNNSLARIYVDAYAAFGNLTLQSERQSVCADAVAVGGEFFMFHPRKLFCGQYFSEEDIRKDLVVVDEDIAWQLFGSSDIAGKDIQIQGQYFTIAGVCTGAQNDLERMAGNDAPTVYLSYDAMIELNGETPITSYEIVIPNPVKGFAVKMLEEQVNGGTGNLLLIENSSRFTYESFYDILKDKAERTMKTDDIVLPFWENVARVKEEKLANTAFVQICILSVLVIYWIGALIVFIVRHKPTKENMTGLMQKMGDFTESIKNNRKRKEGMEYEEIDV